MDTDVFGTNDLVDVMKLELTPELRAMRSQLEQWNGSEHTDYKPHATIGPVGSPIENLPSRLTFDRIVFKWGDATLISDLF
jgi:2'-5' RNA ligase